MKNRKASNWYNNEWIGKATLAGLSEAIEDLDYTWGVHAEDINTEKPRAIVKNDHAYTVKLAA